MAFLSKPLPTNSELMALLDKAKFIKVTPKKRRDQQRSWVIGQMLLSHPQMTRDYVTGIYDAVDAERVEHPHEVAETIVARAIEPNGGAKTRREALNWAADVARSLYPKPEKKE